MPAVLVHEIIHYINQPEDDNRNYVSDYLTEAVSYSYELMFLDSFLKSDYKEDALSIMQSLAYSMKQAVFSAFSPAFSLKLYKLNNITAINTKTNVSSVLKPLLINIIISPKIII